MPVRRRARAARERLGIAPKQTFYSGIGGTTSQQLVASAADAILSGESDVVLITSAEALASQRKAKQRGERLQYSFRPDERRPFPWEAPMHPAEIAHEVFQAWLTFAVFDNARRAHLGVGLDDYRRGIGEMMAPLTEIAARNPDAWFPIARTADEIVTVSSTNRMVGYPYTKYTVAIMDVDMAAAVIVTSHERADALGVPQRSAGLPPRLVLRDRPGLRRRAPRDVALAGDGGGGRGGVAVRGTGIDDVAHFDLYSCFASSLHFARDALGIAPHDPRALSVTGGLPYHGGPGSGYMTHSIAQMARELRADPGSTGMVSGVGMTMTKHAFGVYSTRPGPVTRPDATKCSRRSTIAARSRSSTTWEGEADVAAYSVVHGRDGAPEWALLVCDVGPDARAYARSTEPELLARAESEELVGRPGPACSRPTSSSRRAPAAATSPPSRPDRSWRNRPIPSERRSTGAERGCQLTGRPRFLRLRRYTQM